MGGKILVVEDQSLIRKFICEVLQKVEGYEVDEASDGAQAVELINEQRFDLVISDLAMPRVDGFELLAHVRSMSPATAVIFMTGQLFNESVQASLHGIEFVMKPFALEDLLAAVRRLLPHRQS
jgi:DNA-binding response OmpR family regulator